MSAAVADSWALLAMLRGEQPAAGLMRRYLRRTIAGNLQLLVNVINLGEVYYRIAHAAGEDRADAEIRNLRELPIEIVPARDSLVFEAARIKARHPLSYADAFAVATARIAGTPLLTGDPEILALPKGVVRVRRLDRER